MATAIFKLVAGSYHDWKGDVQRGSLLISEKPLNKTHYTKFKQIQIEQLSPDEVPAYEAAIDRFCQVKVLMEHGKYNVVGCAGIPILRDWTTEAKAKSAATKERAKLDERKRNFLRMLDRVRPVIEREEEHNSLELEEEFDNEEDGEGGHE